MISVDSNWCKRRISLLSIHCSASPDGRFDSVRDIDLWHVERGFGRTPEAMNKWEKTIKACGYHYVIERDGHLAFGRAEAEIPAAVKGFNANMIAVCVVGTKRFSEAQWRTLGDLVDELLERYPSIRIHGHCYWDKVHKPHCPGFDVEGWLIDFVPDDNNVYWKGGAL